LDSSYGGNNSQGPKLSFERIRARGLDHETEDQKSPEERDVPSASVNCILRCSEDSSPEVLLLQRQIAERDPWSGQISFPGGRSKTGEAPLETAKREAMEETGIDLDWCEIVGRLESVLPGNFSIRVTPFLVIAPWRISVTIDHVEIVDYFWVPLDFFAEEKNSQIYTFSRFGRTIQTPSFVVAGKYVVWGMTLRIILNLISELGQNQGGGP